MLKSTGLIVGSGYPPQTTVSLVFWLLTLVMLQQKQSMGSLNDFESFLYDATVAGAMNVTPLLDLPNAEEALHDTFSPIDSPSKDFLESIENISPPNNSANTPLTSPASTLPHLTKFPHVSPLSYLQSNTPSPTLGLPVSQNAGPISKELDEEQAASQVPIDVLPQENMDLETLPEEQVLSGSKALQNAEGGMEKNEKANDGQVNPSCPNFHILQEIEEVRSERHGDSAFPGAQQRATRESFKNSASQAASVHVLQATRSVPGEIPLNVKYQGMQQTIHHNRSQPVQQSQLQSHSMDLQFPPTNKSDDDFRLQDPLDRSLERRNRQMMAISECLRLLPEGALEKILLIVMKEIPPQLTLQLNAGAAVLDQLGSAVREPSWSEPSKHSNGIHEPSPTHSIFEATQPAQAILETLPKVQNTSAQQPVSGNHSESVSNIPDVISQGEGVYSVDGKSLKKLISPLEYAKSGLDHELHQSVQPVILENPENLRALKVETFYNIGCPGESSSQDGLHASAYNCIPVTHSVHQGSQRAEKENLRSQNFQLQPQCIPETEVQEPRAILQASEWSLPGARNLGTTTKSATLNGKRPREVLQQSFSSSDVKRVKGSSDSKSRQKKGLSEAAKLIARKHRDIRLRNQKELAAQSGQPSSTGLPLAPCATPSRFCHLCTRTANQDEVLVCKNVARGACRKVICFRCAEDHRWNVQTLRNDKNWTCTHCRNVSVKMSFVVVSSIQSGLTILMYILSMHGLWLSRSVLERLSAIPISESTNIVVLTVDGQKASPTTTTTTSGNLS